MTTRRSRNNAVVPPLPDGYRDGGLPALPARTAIVHIAPTDPTEAVPAGIEPASLKVQRQPDGTQRGTAQDREVLALMLEEAQMRDALSDTACAEILAALQGSRLTRELCHDIRIRLRKLADDAHALTRIAAAHVHQRERVRTRCKVDPADVCRRVAAKISGGTTTTDSFVEIAEETGAAEETIRNAYYKHRKKHTK